MTTAASESPKKPKTPKLSKASFLLCRWVKSCGQSTKYPWWPCAIPPRPGGMEKGMKRVERRWYDF